MKKKIGNALYLQFIQNEIGGVESYKNLSRYRKVQYKRKMITWYNRPKEQQDAECEELQKHSYEIFAETLGITVEELKTQITINQE